MIRGINRHLKIKSLSAQEQAKAEKSERVRVAQDHETSRASRDGSRNDLTNVEYREGLKHPSTAEGKQFEGELGEEAPEAAVLDKASLVIRQALSIFDEESNRKLNADDLCQVLRELGEDTTLEKCTDAIHVINGTNEIDVDEFVLLMAELMSDGSSEQDIIDSFKVFDRDGTGFIHSSELRRVLVNLGDQLNEKEAVEMDCLHEADANGRVDYKDLVKRLMSTAESPSQEIRGSLHCV